MNIVKNAYYELQDSKIARVRWISPYYPEDVVYTEYYDLDGNFIGFKDFWISAFEGLITRRVQRRIK